MPQPGDAVTVNAKLTCPKIFPRIALAQFFYNGMIKTGQHGLQYHKRLQKLSNTPTEKEALFIGGQY